jgi:hypothetical protein
MEDDLGIRLEKIRRRVEKLEDENDKQDEWKEILNQLNEIKTIVHSKSIFSENEEFKEIKSEDLKYLMISFYQAETLQKFHENRENILKITLQFYKEFYKILEKYDYLNKDRKDYYKKISEDLDEDGEEVKKPSFEELSKEREEKILAFKYKKILSEKLKVSHIILSNPIFHEIRFCKN